MAAAFPDQRQVADELDDVALALFGMNEQALAVQPPPVPGRLVEGPPHPFLADQGVLETPFEFGPALDEAAQGEQRLGLGDMGADFVLAGGGDLVEAGERFLEAVGADQNVGQSLQGRAVAGAVGQGPAQDLDGLVGAAEPAQGTAERDVDAGVAGPQLRRRPVEVEGLFVFPPGKAARGRPKGGSALVAAIVLGVGEGKIGRCEIGLDRDRPFEDRPRLI